MIDTADRAKLFILRSEEIRANALRYLGHVRIDPEHPLEVRIKPHKAKRSLAQNALFHKWMTEVSRKWAEATGKHVEPRVWKEYFKRLFLGEEYHEVNGMKWTETRHTSDLSVKEMSQFMHDVDQFCAAELGILLSHPEDLWREAMGIAA
jgi:hypothetical protein